MSSLRYALLALGLSVLAGCPDQPGTKVCPGTGILCPEQMYCGAVQPICLTTSCGNGLVDPGEECDDGNVLPGDTCSPICRKEACGNNVLDPGEVCDDGNTSPGDGCSPNCMSKEVCGNGVVDVGEACDDGNDVNADGCSGMSIMVNGMDSPGPCKSTEVCGNGIVDFQTGEVCDDGNTTSGDGCNSDCRSGEGCGNGIVDPGELCDDGNANDNDDCLNSCKTARCGDGVIDSGGTHGEQCDPSTTGSPIETATCNIDCTTRACGDGKVNQTAGEQCDNGVGNNGDMKNCTAGCLLNVCGDGKVDMQPPGIEQCDDGNTNNTDGCSNACQLASCGNSTVDTGEMCDDGNMDETDACVMCHNAVCGDGHVHAGVEQCDDGNNTNGDGCSSTCRSEGCGNSILDPGEECDDGNAVNTDGCVEGCRLAVCGDTFIRQGVEQCDDGNVVNGDGCSSTCRSEGCGNGQLDPGEQCDDGNQNNGDGCSDACMFEGCGDGIINNGEQCDGNGAGQGGETTLCNADCTMRRCGDGKVNATAGEQCDSGTVMGVNKNQDNADCTSQCKVNVCTDGLKDTVGPNHFEACDDGNQIATDGCSNNCTLASCGNGLLDPGEQCDDMNTVNTDTCANCMAAICGDGFVETGVEECDGMPVTVNGQTYTCSPTCKLQRCGNGIIDPTKGEQCDNDIVPPGPMLPMPGDGCSPACKFEKCGNGILDPGEQCEPSLAGTDMCDADCTFALCGDSFLNTAHPAGGAGKHEQCEPPNPGNGCTAGCQFESCGNGTLDPGEECDPPNGTTCVGCLNQMCGNGRIDTSSSNPLLKETCDTGGVTDPTCVGCQIVHFCGDGLVTAPEQCDIGIPGSAPACNTDCTSSACGDGKTNAAAGEQCDGGPQSPPMMGKALVTATCDEDCSAAVCGDGKTNTAAGEQCDDGAANNGYDKACLPNCKLNVCGDGFLGPTEMCDNGTGNLTGPVPASCPYNSSCLVCPAGCTTAPSAVMGGFCGNGTPETASSTPPGPEQCDNGASNTNDPNCAYTATQTACANKCDKTCKTLTGVGHYCGDGTIDAPNETCDYGTTNNSGTTCNSSGGAPAYNTPCNACDSCVVKVLLGPRCGDGVLNGGEPCDGTAFAVGKTCASETGGALAGGSLRCSSSCAIDTGRCVAIPPTCGNGVVDSGELCDTNNFAGRTCSSETGGAMPVGSLSCTTCTSISTAGCMATPPPPDAGVDAPPADAPDDSM